ncbi:D-galacturonic acid binding lectin [Plakobranchus ocellatus]|uniref:D-galacturonic acid binding lectin n=1 Tax=Plakobranchus ocellatus TaxID=259542 RepID=A0AAV3ZPE4_9GAST|nr:D-galacturonic acid binding lectin [Plakobranchus ocellatus]
MALAKCYLLVLFLVPISWSLADKDIKCDKVTLKSTELRPVNKIIADKNNVPQEVVSVNVWDQLSEIKCVEWVNFFHYKSFVIVKGGCQAIFEVCCKITVVTTTSAPLTTIKPGCEKVRLLSRKARPVSKDVEAPVVSMRLLKDLHQKVLCEEGVNFRFEGTVVFADLGCRGDFEVCTSTAPLTTTASPEKCKKVILKSTRKRPAQEQITDSTGEPAEIESVSIFRQISSSVKCKEWVNYFVFGSFVIANKGCQACFKVCYKEAPTTAGALTTPMEVLCKIYKVLRPTRKFVRDDNNQPVTITRVGLVREISKNICKEGDNYLFRNSLFIVKRGCKGVFKVFYEVITTTQAPLTTPEPVKPVCVKVNSKSTTLRPSRVNVKDANGNPVHIVHVHVWDQISKIKCVEWANYFYSDSYIITRNGCKATFKVCYIMKKPPTTQAALTTTPEPDICKKYQILEPTTKTVKGSNGQPAVITSFVLVREISKFIKCVEGKNYFFKGSEFVVKGGCKGIFQVCYKEVVTTPAPLTTTTEKPELECKKVTVKSKGQKSTRVDITDANGNPVHIVHAHVWDQISEIKCVEWVNFFYFESYIIAQKGCHATFKVCYKVVKPPTTTPAPLTTTPEPEICQKYKILKPTTVTVKGSNGLPATITSVVLVREISRHKCEEGVNYSFDGSDFVVKGGCKGVFKVCYTETVTTPAPLTTTTEEPTKPICKKIDVKSKGNKPGRVDFKDANGNPVHIVHVHVWDQISEIKCVEWVNYFYSESFIVAKKGCKATFKVCYKMKTPPTTTPAPLTTTPEPEMCQKYKILKPTTITVKGSNGLPATITSVVLVREISRHKCEEGVNYSFDGSDFVVKGGCKGVFKVCYTETVTTPAPLTTTTEEPTKPGCKKIDVKSKGNKPGRVDVKDANGNPVHIVHVHVWDQISEIKCVEWVNYFYSESFIIAKKGCKATFKVCYKMKTPPTTTPAPLTTTPEPEICQKYKILSPTTITVKGSNGLPATITSVVLVREISRYKCEEGVNYSFDGSDFIVTGGCKGVFKVCYTETVTTPAPLTTTTEEPIKPICEKIDVKSKGNKPGRVDVKDSNGHPVHIVHVHVWDQISEIKCVEWVNYFYSESFIIAKKGCQATFKVCYKVKKPPTTTPAPLTTTPEPEICQKYKILKPTTITVKGSNGLPATITSVVLVREISRHKCEEGVNYSFDGSDFIVKGGCKGVFKVCYTETVTTPAPLTTTTEEPAKPICKKIDVKSKGNKPGRVDVTDSNGNPVHIFHVHVWDQISEIKCVEWVNYFYSESFIIAKKGCQATFKVCYKVKKPPTTTPAPLTTTPEPEICKNYKILKPSTIIVKGSNDLPATITSVVLVREISRHKCEEGVNYFFDGSDFVVKGGCKGVFKVCYTETATTPAPLTTTTEEPTKPVCKKIDVKSKGNKPGRVDVKDANGNPVHIVHVHVWDQISEIKCVEWVNYFYSESFIIAKKGCKATFKACFKVKEPPTTTPAPLTTTPEPEKPVCEKIDVKSKGNKPGRVDVKDANGNPVHIVHVHVWDQISEIKCVKWVNYFYSESFIIAKKGCKATFKVCYKVKKPPTTTPAPLTTTPEPEKPVCEKIDVKSKGNKPGRVDVKDSNGNPVHIVHVHVWDQISEIKCVEWVNYFYSESFIIAKKGCQATFKVCYKVKKIPTTTPAPLTTTPEPEKPACKKIDVKSKGKKPGRVDVKDANGNPVHIVHVHVWDQISEIKCVEWVNYFYSESFIIAKKGCQATFKVCYKMKKPSTTTPASLTTTPEPEVCQKYEILKPSTITVKGSNGQPATITSVLLVREISRYKCEEGVNYSFDGSDFVVKGNCKGVFKVCYTETATTPAPLTTTTEEPTKTVCEKIDVKSIGNKPGRVDVKDANGKPVHIVHVHVWDQISEIKCVEWVNYFYFKSFIIAEKGCQATFKVCYKVKKPLTTTPAPLTTTPEPEICQRYKILKPSTITVKGSNGLPATITSVVLVREISRYKCEEGVNYSFDGSDFVVKGGCKGVFKVCYTETVTTSAPLTTTTEKLCEKIDVKSKGNKPARVDVKDSNGNPVHIVHLHVWDQISEIKCVEWVNYFYSESFIIAKKGCQATFKVCYKVKKPSTTTPAPLTTTPEPVKPVCEKITVESKQKVSGRKEITDGFGNPVRILHVHVWDQISEIKCIEWKNYFFFESYIIAQGGCHATFKVCYTIWQPHPTPNTTPGRLTTQSTAESTAVELTTTAANKPECKTVFLNGSGPNGDSSKITRQGKSSVLIISINLIEEVSKGLCEEWVTFFAAKDTIFALDGCKGAFIVCYKLI